MSDQFAPPPRLTDADWVAITAVVYGAPTPAESARVGEIRAMPGGERLLDDVECDAWAGGRGGGAGDTATATDALRDRAASIIRASGVAAPSVVRRSWTAAPPLLGRAARSATPGRLARWAAVGAAALAVVVWAAGLRARDVAGLTTTYTTRAGQRAAVRLADGTRVTLAPRSSLTVDDRFGAARRDVVLRGEAYFDVRTADGLPFTVRAGDATVRVLGTAFTVRHYDGADVRVAVRAGKVAATGGTSRRTPLVLTGGMVARITDSTQGVMPGADVRDYTDWTAGHLAFSRTPVREVLETLGRWYGLEFRLTDQALAGQHVTAVFEADARQEVLQTLQLMLGVRMTFQGNVVTLVPETRHAAPVRGRRLTDGDETTRTEVGR